MKKIKKILVVMSLVLSLVSGSSIAYAGSATLNTNVQRGVSCINNTSVEKSITGVSAGIYMYTKISANNMLYANMVSVSGINVTHSVSYQNQSGHKSMPYKSGYGVAGVKYKLKLLLSTSSLSSSISTKENIVP